LQADWQFAHFEILLGHTKIESTVRYLGIEIDDARNVADQATEKSSRGPTTPSAA
jgi:hypothetical protein